jgi:imidazolonepropionase-like amidohydrolase
VPTLALIFALASVGQSAEATQRRSAWAITDATVITAPGNRVEGATVVLRDGLIEAVGADVAAPADARIIDGTGMTVYAGWIDAASAAAIQQPEAAATGAAARGAARGGRGGGGQLQMLELGAPGVNAQVHPEFIQADNLTNEDAQIESFRDAGFTAALVLPQEGIYRGHSVLVALRQADVEEMVLGDAVTQTIGFSTGGFGRGYPSSAMGVISLIRQVLLDTQRQATWENSYANDPTGLPRPETNPAYTALMPVLSGDRQVIFDASNTRDAKRGLKIAQEFGLAPIIKGNGNEYEMVEAIAEAGAPVIVPLDFPDKPTIGEDADANLDVSFEALRRWADAPGNAAALESAGITFAFTADGLRPDEFAANVRKTIEAGLSEDAALAALTTNPAAMFGVDAILGTIEPGKIANVVVATGAPFAEGTVVRHVFVDGTHTAVESDTAARGSRGGDASGPVDPRGNWAVTMGNGDFSMDMTWSISGEAGAYSGAVDGQPFDRVALRGNLLSVTMATPMGESIAVDVAITGNSLEGDFSAQGFTMNISGRRTSGPGNETIEHGGQQ